MGKSFEQWLAELKTDLESRSTEAHAMAEAHDGAHYPLSEQLGAIADSLDRAMQPIKRLEAMFRSVRDVTQ